MTGATPTYGIPYPDGTTKAYKLGDELAGMALGVESALIAAGIPDVTNPDRAVANSDQARNEHFGIPATDADRLALQRRGAECVRPDKGYTERYFAQFDSSSNPGGTLAAPGWYPVSGRLPSARVIKNASPRTIPGGTWYVATESAYWQEDFRSPEIAPFDGAWTIPPALGGIWRAEANVKLGGNVGMLNAIKLNDSAPSQAGAIAYNGTGNYGSAAPAVLTREIRLSPGDKLRLGIFVPADMAWSTDAPLANYLSITWVRPA